jgi:ABC-type phosphate transport system substrate-binding protein
MTSPHFIRVVLGACLLAAGSGSGRAQTAPHQDFVCMSGASRRVISVYNLESGDGQRQHGGCRVDYMKDGQTTTVYSARNGRAFCAAKAAALATTLAKGNYTCHAETQEKPDAAELPESRSPR